jgi:hypothetical protein
MTVTSEQRWQSATLSEIQDTASRLIDTAALFQAMGSPPQVPPAQQSPAAPSAAPAIAAQ